jgi:hypothetical protein
VFAKFQELWSVRQTFQWFRDHDVELPANPIQGTGLAPTLKRTSPRGRASITAEPIVRLTLRWRGLDSNLW